MSSCFSFLGYSPKIFCQNNNCHHILRISRRKHFVGKVSFWGASPAEIYFMEIISFGAGGRMEECLRLLRREWRGTGDISRLIVLPIPTTKDKKLVTGTDITLAEATESVTEDTLVAGYGIPEDVAEGVASRGGSIYDALLDGEFLWENAEMTAVGAIARIICTEGRQLSDMKVGVVGFGRIGKRLVRHLLYLGAQVRVYSGNRDALSSLAPYGVEVREYGEMSDIASLDILINTAPARLLRESDVKGEVRIIDLASGNFLSGIPRVEKMPSVPSEMFPVSSGRAYAKRILARLN